MRIGTPPIFSPDMTTTEVQLTRCRYSILKFSQEGAEDTIKHLTPGDMVLVEGNSIHLIFASDDQGADLAASMSVRQLDKPEGEYPRSEIILV